MYFNMHILIKLFFFLKFAKTLIFVKSHAVKNKNFLNQVANFYIWVHYITVGMSVSLGKILDSKAAGIAVFTVSGLGKLASDYTKAPDDKKEYTLLRDSLILGGSALGVMGYEGRAKRLLKSKFFKTKQKKITDFAKQKLTQSNIYSKTLKPVFDKYGNAIRSGANQIKDVVYNCLDNAAMLAFGIGGSMLADYAIRYSHLEKINKFKKISKHGNDQISNLYNVENKLANKWQNSSINKNLGNTVGDEVKSNIYSRVTDLPIMRMFSKTMVGMQGFEVIEEKTFRERLKHSRQCLITNSLVPLFFLSTATALTKKLKGIIRYPVVFASLVAGTMYTNKMIDKMSHHSQKPTKTAKVEPPKQPQTAEIQSNPVVKS